MLIINMPIYSDFCVTTCSATCIGSGPVQYVDNGRKLEGSERKPEGMGAHRIR